MSLTAVRPFLRGRLDSLGYTEWRDAFNIANIPDNLLDTRYHLEVATVAPFQVANQYLVEFSFPVLVRLFQRGTLDTAEMIDDLLLRGDTFIKDVLDPTQRTDDVKQVIVTGFTLVPYDPTNDNIAILEIGLELRVLLCPNNV